MTTSRVPPGEEPTSATLAHQVFSTLLDHGRWNDAATCYSAVEGRDTGVYAELLLAAGRAGEAEVVLAGEAEHGDLRTAFLRSAQAVLTRDQLRFPELVAASAAPAIATDPLADLVMMRAAQAVGRPQVAAHFATRLRAAAPGDVEASAAVVVDLVSRGAYLDAVKVIDRADAWHCDDEPRPLDRALDALESTGEAPKGAALAVIGDYLHREADPTLPVSVVELAARDRWRRARRQRTRRVPLDWLAWVVVVCVVGAVGFAVTGSGWPAGVCSLVVGGWLRRRPLPGVDPASSRLVRALGSPVTRLSNRRYHVADVITFIATYGATISLVSLVPADPDLLATIALLGGLLVALAATRGRRRWVRRERTKLQRPALDPAICRCLDIDRLHRETAQRYVDGHLFPVHDIADLPGWRLVQCLETYRYFLTCPAAGLTVALSTQP